MPSFPTRRQTPTPKRINNAYVPLSFTLSFYAGVIYRSNGLVERFSVLLPVKVLQIRRQWRDSVPNTALCNFSPLRLCDMIEYNVHVQLRNLGRPFVERPQEVYS